MKALFDETMEQLLRDEYVGLPVAGLIAELYDRRRKSGPNEWRELVGSGLRRHPVYPLLLEDPFVRHSAERPRGYPGDAELLDYIYGCGNAESMVERASTMGKRLHEYDRSTPAPAAVRNRSRMAAAEIDRMAATGMRPHVLSIACGHLREADRLQSLRADTIGRFVGLDQDSRSLEVVRREWNGHAVEARQCDAQTLLRKGIADLGKFDFIYSLGLYDYLSDAAARRLLSTAVDMLNPGGKVWIANFVEDLWSAGYMEAVMDWWLIYRSDDKINALASRIDPGKIAGRRTFREPESNVVFLELTHG
jgi:extracellular factor (EF) 3-hydroxypalmitic acid methyl ester biosynthesis protein